MDTMTKVGTLLKCLLCIYVLTSVFIIRNLNYYKFELSNNCDNFDYATFRNRAVVSSRNITKIAYETKTIYLNKTIVKYIDRSSISHYGPGENGTKVEKGSLNGIKLSETELETRKKFHGFDTLISDTVSLHRKLPDHRLKECREKVYPKDMPPVSVVIIFRNEWHSILLRTAYSVLEMSPPDLLKEIILVDDGSTDAELITKVNIHVANVDKFTLVRNEVSLGLMMARQKGIDSTSADYFIVMDGHMEAAPGWLEPLIYRLTQEPNALLCSHIGQISAQNFEFYDDHANHIQFDAFFPFFDPLTLDQLWAPFSPDFRTVRNMSVEPIPYGTLQGMLLVMRKQFFYQLGGFDPGMKVWGSEQIELSVKVWLCGGRVEMIPCSKVAHMYRHMRWERNHKDEDFGAINKLRMVGVWMEPPFSDYIYHNIKLTNFSKESLSDRLRIRGENNCKPYQFFVDTVKQFSSVYFPIKPKQVGAVYNMLHKKCLDIAKINTTETLILFQCHGVFNQYFLLTEQNEIRSSGGRLIQAIKTDTGTELKISVNSAPMNHPSVTWEYKSNGHIYHAELNLCLVASSDYNVSLADCSDALSQIWRLGELDNILN